MTPTAQAARARTLLGCVVVAAASVPVAVALGNVRLPLLLVGAAGLAALAAIVVRGWLRPALMILYIVAITYNRQYYSFDWLHGDLGGRGFYWGPGDLCLAGLFLLWLIERALRIPCEPGRTRGPSGAAWLLPFILVGALSAAASTEPVGSSIELLRYVKLTLLLLYLRYNLDHSLRTAMILAFAGVILLQAPISALQVAFASGQNGLSQIFRTSEPGELARRASGTLGHPNYLAPYLLLIVPSFAAIALGRPHTLAGRVCTFIAASGVVTVVLTQSRGPVLLIFCTLMAMVALLALRRAIIPMRAVGLLVGGAASLVLAVMPLASVIERRLTGDLAASVNFRAAYNDSAVQMWEANSILGVGPNNFGLEIRRYSPDLYVVMTLDALAADTSREKAHLRNIAPVHNAYLFIVSEFGFLGLCCFLIFLARCLVLAWQASDNLQTSQALFAAGALCGLLAEYVQQQIDYSLLWDPILSTLVLLVGLLQSLVNDRRNTPCRSPPSPSSSQLSTAPGIYRIRSSPF